MQIERRKLQEFTWDHKINSLCALIKTLEFPQNIVDSNKNVQPCTEAHRQTEAQEWKLECYGKIRGQRLKPQGQEGNLHQDRTVSALLTIASSPLKT